MDTMSNIHLLEEREAVWSANFALFFFHFFLVLAWWWCARTCCLLSMSRTCAGGAAWGLYPSGPRAWYAWAWRMWWAASLWSKHNGGSSGASVEPRAISARPRLHEVRRVLGIDNWVVHNQSWAQHRRTRVSRPGLHEVRRDLGIDDS